MASTFTTNIGIEKPATGDKAGTWGTMSNTNMDLIDEATNGVVEITLAATGSSDLLMICLLPTAHHQMVEISILSLRMVEI